MKDRSPLVSVVIPTYRREEILCSTLDRLLQQSYPHYEIIVVDQTPEHLPVTEEHLRSLASAGLIRYYRLLRASLPGARNFGVRHASGDIVLFVDDDVDPDPGLIAAHVAAYEDPSVGGVAGRRIIPGKQEALGPVGVIDAWGNHVSNFSSIIPTTVEWASGCHMSFRRELIFRTGLFEPKFLGNAVYEDVDFCFRLRRLGYEIRFVPQAHLIHLEAASGGCENRRQGLRFYYSMIHNSLLFFLRHYPVSQLPRLFFRRVLMILAIARKTRNPLVVFLLSGAFFQVFYSYLVARRSLPKEVQR